MYYYLIPMAILFTLVTFSHKFSVSPFASRLVKQICANMTKTERIQHNLRGAVYGLILGIIPGAIGFGIGLFFFRTALNGVMVAALLVPLFALVLSSYTNKSQKSFLASTEWTKSQGIKADDINLFTWNEK